LARGISGRVLLVDADMRRPHLHRLLDQDPENGLVDYLAGRVEINNIIRSTWVDRLDFVASGVLDTPVGVLLASDRFERFLRAVEKQYEFIVIDVPPILPVSEGLVISKAADGAIFCVLRDVSTTANVARACEKLRNAGVHILGAVFNGVPAREYGSSGYYYYRIPQTNGSVDKVDVN
jgi:capsular exopolysaccharide synthesis family protein